MSRKEDRHEDLRDRFLELDDVFLGAFYRVNQDPTARAEDLRAVRAVFWDPLIDRLNADPNASVDYSLVEQAIKLDATFVGSVERMVGGHGRPGEVVAKIKSVTHSYATITLQCADAIRYLAKRRALDSNLRSARLRAPVANRLGRASDRARSHSRGHSASGRRPVDRDTRQVARRFDAAATCFRAARRLLPFFPSTRATVL